MPLAGDVMRLTALGVKLGSGLLEWLMTYAIHSTLLIGGLLLLTAIPAGRRALSVHGSWLWRFALVGGVVTASLQSVRTASPLAGTVRLDGDTPTRTTVRMEVTRTNTPIMSGAVVPGRLEWRSTDGAQRIIKSTIDVTPGWSLLVLGSWVVIAVALLARFLVARRRFLRSVDPRRPADHTLAGNALRHLRRESRVEHDVALTVSNCLTSPVALSVNEICLPERALSELGPIRVESILAHELAHVVRRDPMWLTIARVIEAIFFFQPLNLIARRRMQVAAEFASDAWASRRVSKPLDLAHCLARVAEWTIAAPRLPVPAMAERRGAVLVRRVQRLTSGQMVQESTPGRATRLAAVAALVALVFAAPRAAVGAERQAGNILARVPELKVIETDHRDAVNIVMIRRFDSNQLRLNTVNEHRVIADSANFRGFRMYSR